MKKLLIALAMLLIPSFVSAEFIGVMGRVNPETTVVIVDDFLGGNNTTGSVGQLGWTHTNATLSSVNVGTNHPGVRNLSADISTNGALGLATGTSNTVDPDDMFDVTFIIRPQTVVTEELRAGLGGAITTSPPASGIYFVFDTAATSSETAAANVSQANWVCVTRDASTSTVTDSGIAVSSAAWDKLRIQRTSATTLAWYIDGVQVCTDAVYTNAPSVNNFFFVQLEDTGGIAAKDVDIDYFRASISGMVR